METDINKGKTAAITSYILGIGVLIAMSMNSEEESDLHIKSAIQTGTKSEFASFHIRQGLGITLTFISLGLIISPFNNIMITLPMWIFVSVLWGFGMFSAISGSTKPMPIVGAFYQKFLKGIS